MPHNSLNAARIQRQYYADTARQYDAMHAHEAADDSRNFKLLCSLLRMIEPRTILDVGAGTGRVMRRLMDDGPDWSIRGVEPVAELIERAIENNRIPEGAIVQAVGEALPFADASFDVVCSFAILHHVPEPDVIIREMLRVARKAVIIIDSNRFGQGSWPVRLLKLALYRARLWQAINYVKTRGKGYLLTEGDGLAYSYSVYDSFELIAEWAAEMFLIPAERCTAKSWIHPLLTSGAVLVCALKESN
jgi:ubiquinone/menaquinone biosynthesis C-methylase UbiE